MGIVMSIREKIEGFLGLWIEEQAGYLINYNSNLSTLRREVQKLRDIQEGVLPLIDNARRKGEVILPVVVRWRTNVDKINEEIERFLKDEVGVNNRWLNGWCPDLRSRHSLSRKATEKTVGVTRLQAEGSFERVSNPAPSPGFEHTATGDFVDFESRKSVMDDIMAALKDDTVDAIGICGLGGTGKTTTAKVVGKRAKAEGLFNEIVIATVTRTPDVKGIQVDIADMLGLNFKEVKGLPARASRIRARLTNCERVLVILDDVWERLDLETVGIPFGGDHKGCKLLLTSRSQNVCNEMETHQNFTIEVLSKVEAWNLFKGKAGDYIESLPIAEQVLNECGCLPIAIVTVGKALRKKEEHVWKDALRLLKLASPEKISGTVAKVYRSLELSYNFLESPEEKLCLLLCCAFKEDTNIWVEDLVGYMVSLGILEGIDEPRNRALTVVDKLKSCYLLLDGDVQERKCVKMHDLVRDVIRAMLIGKPYTTTSLVSHSASPEPELGMEYMSIGGFVDFDCRRSIMEEIMAALRDDNINAIGIYGVGGVGKTTFVKEVCKRAKEEKLFDVIVTAVVSQTPDLEEIQDAIANSLSWKLNEHSLPRRADRLRVTLMDRKTVLVVLDDVWGRLDLQAVGIPFGGDHKGCKLLLTSRSQHVCDVMGTCKIFCLEVLRQQESWQLFSTMGDGDSIDSPDFHPIAMNIVEECRGLPLLALIVRRALENSTLPAWRDALLMLMGCNPDVPVGEMNYLAIMLSYELLGSQVAQSCLLLCSIFKEDANIPVEELVRFGMGLGLFKDIDAVEVARERVRTIVNKLKRRYLLLDGDKNECVKMHDVVRDVIRFMARLSRQQRVEDLKIEDGEE